MTFGTTHGTVSFHGIGRIRRWGECPIGGVPLLRKWDTPPGKWVPGRRLWSQAVALRIRPRLEQPERHWEHDEQRN